jgi:hypothetical protein
MPPRRLAIIDTRDAYLSIADRAVRDSALRLMAARFVASKGASRPARRSAGRARRAS